VVPGTEAIALADLKRAGASVGGSISHIDKRDSIVLFASDDVASTVRCGTLEDVFRVVLDAPTPPGRGAPKVLARAIDRAVLDAALVAHHALRPRRHGRTYKVVARVAGRQAFHREDVEKAFDAALGAALPRWSAAQDAAIELWVHVVGERTIAGIRLSGDELAQRTYKHAHLPASLKPTVARALVLLTEPQATDIVLDPMAGAGTILRERAEAMRSGLIIGGDVDARALEAARTNAGKQSALALWDATRLPLRDGCVDVVVTNPPYGRKHEAIGGLDRLYARMVREIARVLRPSGRCVILTGEPAILVRALSPALEVRSRQQFVVRGLTVTAFVLERL
jgi:23S rRNA G2445 N2-methylase RlmL